MHRGRTYYYDVHPAADELYYTIILLLQLQ